MSVSWRSSAVYSTAALSVVLLSACSPPHENDSTLTVPTTTGSGGISFPSTISEDVPGFIDCVSTPEMAPESLSLDCTDDQDMLSGVRWQSWGKDTAVGTGTRTLIDATGAESITADVEVELSHPTETSQGLVFSQVSIDDQVINL